MFSHIMLGANDLEVSRDFYDAVLGALGVKPGNFSHNRYIYFSTKNGHQSFAMPLNAISNFHKVNQCNRNFYISMNELRPYALAYGFKIGDTIRFASVSIYAGGFDYSCGAGTYSFILR